MTDQNEDKVYFFWYSIVIFDHLGDTVFAIMLVYLIIKFTKPYTIEQHASFMLVISQDLNVIKKAISNAERMAAAERLMQACRDDADRTMVHLLAQIRDNENSIVQSIRGRSTTVRDGSLYDQIVQFKLQHHKEAENTVNATQQYWDKRMVS